MCPLLNFPFPGESKELNRNTRANLDGDFIELTDGITFYELAGELDAPLVVMVHGF